MEKKIDMDALFEEVKIKMVMKLRHVSRADAAMMVRHRIRPETPPEVETEITKPASAALRSNRSDLTPFDDFEAFEGI